MITKHYPNKTVEICLNRQEYDRILGVISTAKVSAKFMARDYRRIYGPDSALAADQDAISKDAEALLQELIDSISVVR